MSTRKTALITGSTSGIGLGVARALAAAGHAIVLNGFGEAAAIETLRAGLAAEFKTSVTHNNADMTDPAAIGAMVKSVEESHGAIDILVNNAGVQFVSPIEDFPVEKWDQILAIDLSSSFHTIRHVLPGMKQRRSGRIIQIGSAHSLVASPFKSAYVAAKHGIAGLTKTVALEAAPFGITVNSVCPGYVFTPLVEKQIPEQAKARGITEEAVVRDVLLAAQPTKRFVAIEEVAALVHFLCSDAACSITGASIPIDGGWTAQ
jgi:3-hydroxybutyrate dehydrogenase